MVPYVIRQGDYLAKLAFRFGFDADEVWDHPENAALKDLRRDPNILCPGDILRIPERARRGQPLQTGGTNRFECDVPGVDVRLRLVGERGAPHANKACTVRGLPEPLHKPTDGDGVLSFHLPVTVTSVRIDIDDLRVGFDAWVGALDPAAETSGRRMRLGNLGFLGLPGSNVRRAPQTTGGPATLWTFGSKTTATR